MSEPAKIAILGGGVASMSAAYYLTSRPDWKDHYEVTVYQMGWRLGGKGASGRNANMGQRIEEHGLHVWGGFYENAFALMRACYGELDRPEGAPLRSWKDAFIKQSFVVWEEEVEEGKWEHWPIPFPENSDEPGDGTEFPSIWAYLEMLLGWILNAMRQFPLIALRDRSREPETADRSILPDWLREAAMATSRVWGKVFDGSPFWMLREAAELAGSLATATEKNRSADMYRVLDYLKSFMNWLEAEAEEQIWNHTEARRAYILMALGATVVRGMIVDGVLTDGFFALDDYDLKEWLARHGASEKVLDSAPVWAYYDYFFAYEDGNTEKPRMSAGMGLNHLLRLVLAYKGSIFWKMASGMGDVVFAPMYQVLKARGVKFEFFHMVEGLELSDDYGFVERIKVARQVAIKGGKDYDPLVVVKDLPCWPSEPDWEQIVGGEILETKGYNYEDRFSDWAPVEERMLQRGTDFDYAVLGISIGEFPYIADPLIENDEDWEIMVKEIQAIQTVALQLWFNEDKKELGWELPTTVMTAYAQPIETWLDASAVIPREDWPEGEGPKNIAYYCGPLTTEPTPEGKDPAYGEEQDARAKQVALDWLSKNLNHLFPNATMPDDPRELNWSTLLDPKGGSGAARFDSQYWRSNYTPTERYVISRPGTNRFRMTSNTSGYGNLVLAGDWLYTGLGGSVEGAVMSGMTASQALCNYPERIVGGLERNPWQRPVSVSPIVDSE